MPSWVSSLLTWSSSLLSGVLEGLLIMIVISGLGWLAWRMKQGRNIPLLIQQLGSQSSDQIRNRAMKRLVKMPNKAIPVLVEAACDREDSNRSKNASEVLVKIGSSAIRSMIEHRAITKTPNLKTDDLDDALCRMNSDQDIRAHVDLLRDKDWRIQRDAADFLGRLGDNRAIEPLATFARDHSTKEYVRAQCAHSLGSIGGPQVAGHLQALLDTGYPPKVRSLAAQALGRAGESQAIPDLLNVLGTDDSPDVLIEAALSLGKLEAHLASSQLVLMLSHDDWRVVQAAAEALGCLKAPAALPVLWEKLRDANTDRQVKQTCIKAIEDINGSEGKTILDEGNQIFVTLDPPDRDLQWECLNAWRKLDQRGV